ncbi:DUF3934 domain-containing protein [Paenibacillus radicis (ex Gao et al. 2016)]|uniref:DUF3934 domain-containing protein n=1 Tax=Paenibacillus radicis (ex Gao et al. 2016) TaxID=1737354 RepID=A0A917M524_9BACL|nr:DUF3934 domain-containing protein [Paenibacillus radicis (ex Gao et al. 2016)]GGG79259.1 hypothetical protein GCM10010918_40380 [Paenibacillus radicis (ex Gao et al. 2016)]
MTKGKKKSGIGQGTGKKGWSRWDKAAKAKSVKRVFSKNGKPGAAGKKADEGAGASASVKKDSN